jgi:hypothetical protein
VLGGADAGQVQPGGAARDIELLAWAEPGEAPAGRNREGREPKADDHANAAARLVSRNRQRPGADPRHGAIAEGALDVKERRARRAHRRERYRNGKETHETAQGSPI